jgi:hypothetical protein
MVLGLHTAADMTDFPALVSRLPLLLLLLAPGVGLAAQEPPVRPEARDTVRRPLLAVSALPGTEERAPLRLREDGPAEEDDRPSRGLRILAETGAGLLTGLGGGLVGVFAGAGLCEAGLVGSQGGFIGCLDAGVGGLLLGAGAGFALGVWWGGEAAGGDGKLLGAMAGFGGGAALGLLAVAATQSANGLLIGLPLSMIGAIVGYELSQRAPASGPSSPSMASPRPRLQPVLAFSSRGALVGLGGSF